MAALPSNNTGVFYLDYSAGGEDHTLQIRFGDASSPGEAMTVAHNLLTALDAGLTLLTVRGARVRDQGSNVSYAVTWTGDASYGGSAGAHEKAAYYIDFVGRSLGGRRVRIAVFGMGDAFDATNHDYRYTAAESEIVANAIEQLEAGSAVPVAVDGDVAAWHQYANVGVNAYWRNRIR